MTKKKPPKRKRRENGEGTLYQLKDGRFGAAVYYDDHGKRKRKEVSAKTAELAKQKMADWLKEQKLIENAPESPIDSQTLAEDFVQEFMKNGMRNRITSNELEWDKVGKNKIISRTYENYAYMMKHFENYFKGCGIGSITTSDMNDFFENETRFSSATIHRVFVVVNMMYNRGVHKHYIENNPLSDADFSLPDSKIPDKEVSTLSDDEVNKLLWAVEDTPTLRPMIILDLYTGGRIQEVIGLKWNKIDLTNCQIHIKRAMTTNTQYDKDGNKIGKTETVLGRTKRKGSIRSLFVDEDIVHVINEWKSFAAEHTKTKFGDDDFVFGNKKQDHWTYSGLRSSLRKVLDRKLGKGHGINLHRIRHTVATKMADNQATKLEIMQLLGDTQEKTIMRYISKTDTIAQNNQVRISQSWKSIINL